jgi:RNA polymerase sigma-70 factor (ECF subfamily)
MVKLSAGNVDIKDLPPVVIRTFPVAGSTMVDPAITKVYVTFSHKMSDKSWSFVKGDEGFFPKLNGSPSYDHTMQTCTLNVSLEPDTTYVIWINSGKFMNFKSTAGKSAVPYMLSFKTAGAGFDAQKSDAIKASKKWLKLLEYGKYSESWRESAPLFKSRVSMDVWKKQIGVIYNQLGKIQSRKFLSAAYTESFPKTPKGKYFIIRFETSFEGKKGVIETIVPVLNKEGKWRITGYFIK